MLIDGGSCVALIVKSMVNILADLFVFHYSRFGFGFGGTGKKSNNKQFDNYGEPFGKSDVISCLIDADSGEIKFLKNGVDLGTAFRADKNLFKDGIFPAVVLKVRISRLTSCCS